MQILKNGLENELLGPQEKLSFLLAGIENVDAILSIKILIDEENKFIDAVEVRKDSVLDSGNYLTLDNENLFNFDSKTFLENIEGHISLTTPHNFEINNLWYSDAILKIELYPGAISYLVARVNMNGFKESIESHPFNQSGEITIINKYGNTIFDSNSDLIRHSLLSDISSLFK